MDVIKLILQFIIAISALKNIFKNKRFNMNIEAVFNSKLLKHFQYIMIFSFIVLGLLYGFLAGAEKVLQGKFLLGVLFFMLMSIATLFFAFVHYKLEQK